MLREQREADDVDELLDPDRYDPVKRNELDLAAIVTAGGEVL